MSDILETIQARRLREREEREKNWTPEEETYCEDERTCPNCGYQFTDSWECGDSGEEECECGCKFAWDKDVTVSYSSKIIK